jgi:hypothetical protein
MLTSEMVMQRQGITWYGTDATGFAVFRTGLLKVRDTLLLGEWFLTF